MTACLILLWVATNRTMYRETPGCHLVEQPIWTRLEIGMHSHSGIQAVHRLRRWMSTWSHVALKNQYNTLRQESHSKLPVVVLRPVVSCMFSPSVVFTVGGISLSLLCFKAYTVPLGRSEWWRERGLRSCQRRSMIDVVEMEGNQRAFDCQSECVWKASEMRQGEYVWEPRLQSQVESIRPGYNHKPIWMEHRLHCSTFRFA